MKGIVFTEFIDFVEQEFSIDQAQTMIDACELDSGGAYTSVGTYDHMEMVKLIGALSKQSQQDANKLLYQFGVHLMGVFATKFKIFIERADGLFDFLTSVEDHIHVEVRKLYPDAELPSLITTEMTDDHMVLEYRSSRCLSPLAEGLIVGASKQFQTPVRVETQTVTEAGSPVVRFTVHLERHT